MTLFDEINGAMRSMLSLSEWGATKDVLVVDTASAHDRIQNHYVTAPSGERFIVTVYQLEGAEPFISERG